MTWTRQMAQVSHSTSQLHMAAAFHFFSENILPAPTTPPSTATLDAFSSPPAGVLSDATTLISTSMASSTGLRVLCFERHRAADVSTVVFGCRSLCIDNRFFIYRSLKGSHNVSSTGWNSGHAWGALTPKRYNNPEPGLARETNYVIQSQSEWRN